MTLQAAFLAIPPFPGSAFSTTAPVAKQINAASEKVAFRLECTVAGTIRKVGFSVGAVGTAGDVDVRLEGIDGTTGDPNGTLLDVSADKTVTVSAAGWVEADFGVGSGAAVSLGQEIAVVIQDNASSAPDITIDAGYADFWSPNNSYITHYTGTWAKDNSNIPNLTLELSTGALMPGNQGWICASDEGTHFYNNTDSPNYIGNIFQVPYNCRVSGCWVYGDLDQDSTVILYDSDGTTELGTSFIDPNVRSNTSGNETIHALSATKELTINTNYRIVHRPDTATDCRLYYLDVNAAGDWGTWPGPGSEMHQTHKTNSGGAWTETTTRRAMVGVIIDQLDDGAGGGAASGARNPLRGPIG